MIKLDITKVAPVVSAAEVNALEARVVEAQKALEEGTCPGNDFLGWLHLPTSITPEFLADVKATAAVLRGECEAVVVAGIGGSYLGAKAVIEALISRKLEDLLLCLTLLSLCDLPVQERSE